jgi:hypothetical protein
MLSALDPRFARHAWLGDDGFTKPMAYVVLRQGCVQSNALIAELCAAVRPLGGYKSAGAL